MENNKYNDVIDFINEQIDNRMYVEGQMIDSENVLSEKLGVSRVTIRKALDQLVSKGILYKEKGRGTFVSNKPKYAAFRCGLAFTKEAKKRGLTPSTKDANIILCEATESIAKELKIPVGTKIWKVTRVRCADTTPIVYAIEYFIYSQTKELTLDIINRSIYEYLHTIGISASYFDQKLIAVVSDTDISTKLNIPINTPLIEATITTYTKNGIPFSYSIEYYRTDKFSLLQTVYMDNT